MYTCIYIYTYTQRYDMYIYIYNDMACMYIYIYTYVIIYWLYAHRTPIPINNQDIDCINHKLHGVYLIWDSFLTFVFF